MIAKGDSGATSHYIREEDQSCLLNIQKHQGPTITLPDASTLTSTKLGTLPLPTTLSSKAKYANIVPGLKSASLISLSQLCDDGCDVLLNDKNLYAVKDKQLVLQGFRNKHDKLWDIPLPQQYPHEKTALQLYIIINHQQYTQDYMAIVHHQNHE